MIIKCSNFPAALKPEYKLFLVTGNRWICIIAACRRIYKSGMKPAISLYTAEVDIFFWCFYFKSYFEPLSADPNQALSTVRILWSFSKYFLIPKSRQIKCAICNISGAKPVFALSSQFYRSVYSDHFKLTKYLLFYLLKVTILQYQMKCFRADLNFIGAGFQKHVQK